MVYKGDFFKKSVILHERSRVSRSSDWTLPTVFAFWGGEAAGGMENWDPKVRNQFKKKLRDLRFEGTVQNSYTKQLIANREAKAKAKEQQQEEVVFFSFKKK